MFQREVLQNEASRNISKFMRINHRLLKSVKKSADHSVVVDKDINRRIRDLNMSLGRAKEERRKLDMYLIETLYFEEDFNFKFDSLKFIQTDIIKKQMKIEKQYRFILTQSPIVNTIPIRYNHLGQISDTMASKGMNNNIIIVDYINPR